MPFLWPARNLIGVWLVAVGLLLAAFFAIDWWLARTEPPAPRLRKFSLRGWGNVVLVLIMAASVTISASPVLFAVVTGAFSLWITPRSIRRANDFSWHPMIEVAILFAGIFITLEPVSALLRLGVAGPFAPGLRLTLNAAGEMRPVIAFWLSGLLSAFLDNAPSYLVFFDLAGIAPGAMTAAQSASLQAISAGAVMFGGLTYIGNASNLVVRTVASRRGVRMPGFVPFMLWAAAVMLPVLAAGLGRVLPQLKAPGKVASGAGASYPRGSGDWTRSAWNPHHVRQAAISAWCCAISRPKRMSGCIRGNGIPSVRHG